jgi:hypothetical protein
MELFKYLNLIIKWSIIWSVSYQKLDKKESKDLASPSTPFLSNRMNDNGSMKEIPTGNVSCYE